MKWTKQRSKLAHAAKARLRIQRAEAGENEPEPVRVPRSEYLGTLQWVGADGQVRRWIIRQGWRANSIAVVARVFGVIPRLQERTWTWLFTGLRKALAITKRITP